MLKSYALSHTNNAFTYEKPQEKNLSHFREPISHIFKQFLKVDAISKRSYNGHRGQS